MEAYNMKTDQYNSMMVGHIYHQILHSISMIELMDYKYLEELLDRLSKLRSNDDNYCIRRIIQRYESLIKHQYNDDRLG